MTQTLNPHEIEALLTAVGGDEPPGAGTREETPERTAGASRTVVAYDFKRPERVSKEHIRALASLHDGFARNFGATLSGLLRTIVDVRVVGVEQLTYSEFIHSLPNPTCFMTVQAPPLEGQMCLELSPLIVYPIIDRLLGGNSGGMFIPSRSLTSIEWRIIGRILDRALQHLSDVWKNLSEARFQLVEQESNPQLVHIVAPTEVVVFITFEIKMGVAAGTMSMCVPFNTIESVLSKLTTQSWFGFRPKEASPVQKQRIYRKLTRATVQLAAYLGGTRLHLAEVRNFQVGDVLQLDKEATQEVILQIEGRNKFAGRPVQYRAHRAFCITRNAAIDEPL